MKTPPGHVPMNYKKRELEQYFQQEEDFIRQLKENLRQKTQRATRISYKGNQDSSYTNLPILPQDVGSNQQIQQDKFENPIYNQQRKNSEDKSEYDNENIERSESEVCYDDDDIDKQCIGYNNEEEQIIIDKVKQMHQENMFKKANQRFCKKCKRFKPDRTHHCSQCRVCIIKMDHHCQWLDSCIGFYNYKYFFVMLFYASIITIFVTLTFDKCYLDSTVTQNIGIFRLFMIALMFYFTLIIAVIIFFFWLFHLWLTVTNKTTIEWCEKKKDSTTGKFNIGCIKNIKQNLNSNPLLWCLPTNPNLENEGLYFPIRDDYYY